LKTTLIDYIITLNSNNTDCIIINNKMFIGQNIANSMAPTMMNGGVSDQQLRQYIDQVMYRYDTNRNGTLEAHELARFFNELFQMCGINRRINNYEASNFMRQVDMNFDRKANKFELFRAFKMMISNQGGGYGSNSNEWNPNFAGYANSYGGGFGGGYGGSYGGSYGGFGGGFGGGMGGMW
jgi:hypothetical protein